MSVLSIKSDYEVISDSLSVSRSFSPEGHPTVNIQAIDPYSRKLVTVAVLASEFDRMANWWGISRRGFMTSNPQVEGTG